METQTIEIVNTHQQLVAAGGGIAIVTHRGGARSDYVAGWGVYRVGPDGKKIDTNPNAPWYDYGKKVFLNSSFSGSFHERSRAALERAKQWITEQGWHKGNWKRNRMRDYVPAEIDLKFPIRKRDTTHVE